MNKKIILKFFVLGLGIFLFAGCSIYPFSTSRVPAKVPVPAPTAASSAEQKTTATVSFGRAAGELTRGKSYGNYQLTFPAGYFNEDPKVLEVTCDFKNSCPCVMDFADLENTCKLASSSRVVINAGAACAQQWSGAAAGSTYVTYNYTIPLPGTIAGKDNICASLQLVKRFTSDCHVFGGADAAQQTAQCEKEKADAPGIINQVVSSFELIQ